VVATGPQRVSEREEKLLEDLIVVLTAIKNTDGIKKIQEAIALVTGTTVNVQQADSTKLKGTVYQPSSTLLRSLVRSWSLNLGGIVNGDFEDDLEGWLVVLGNPTVVASPVYFGLKALNMPPNSKIQQIITPPIRTNQTETLYFQMLPRGAGETLYFKVYYHDGSTDTFDYRGISGVWNFKTYSIFAGKKVLAIEFSTVGNSLPMGLDFINLSCASALYVEGITDSTTRELGIVTSRALLPDEPLNFGHIANGDFETGDLFGWVNLAGAENALIDTTWVYSGKYSCRLKHYAGYGIYQPINPPLEVDYLLVKSVMVLRNNSDELGVTAYYSDGSTSVQTFSPTYPFTWNNLTLTFTAGKKLSGIYFYNNTPLGTQLYIDHIRLKGRTSTDVQITLQKFLIGLKTSLNEGWQETSWEIVIDTGTGHQGELRGIYWIDPDDLAQLEYLRITIDGYVVLQASIDVPNADTYIDLPASVLKNAIVNVTEAEVHDLRGLRFRDSLKVECYRTTEGDLGLNINIAYDVSA